VACGCGCECVSMRDYVTSFVCITDACGCWCESKYVYGVASIVGSLNLYKLCVRERGSCV